MLQKEGKKYSLTVLHLSKYDTIFSGNFAASLESLHFYLKGINIRCVLGFPEKAKARGWSEKMKEKGCEVEYLLNKGRFKRAIQIRRLIKKFKPDIIHTHFTQFDIPAVIARYTLPYSIKPKIIWQRHSDFGESRSLKRYIRSAIKHKIFGRSVKQLAVSHSIADNLLWEGASPKNVDVLGNCIVFEDSRLKMSNEFRKDIRKKLEIRDNEIVFLMFGWSPVVKGVDIAINAMKVVREKFKDCCLVIVADTPTEKYIAELGYGELSYIKQIPPRANIGELYSISDVFLSASRSEGFSYSLCEAAYHRPVISSDIPGVKHLHQVSNVIFFKSEDINSLSDKMKECLFLFENGKKPSSPSVDELQERFGIQVWNSKLHDIYKSISK